LRVPAVTRSAKKRKPAAENAAAVQENGAALQQNTAMLQQGAPHSNLSGKASRLNRTI
jgi:hypothetical protein